MIDRDAELNKRMSALVPDNQDSISYKAELCINDPGGKWDEVKLTGRAYLRIVFDKALTLSNGDVLELDGGMARIIRK